MRETGDPTHGTDQGVAGEEGAEVHEGEGLAGGA